MTAILIEAVSAVSIGSHPVEITAIDPTTQDCLIGTITTPNLGATRKAWNLRGYSRDGLEELNLDMQSDDLAAVIELAGKLGAHLEA